MQYFSPEYKLIDAGIDYARLTSQEGYAKNRMRQKYLEIENSDRVDGYKPVKGGAFGFYGDKCRHALYGVKDEWAMLQISGSHAKRINLLANFETQATRLDIQLTYLLSEGKVAETMEDIYMQANVAKRGKGGSWHVKRIQEGYETQTIYIGSRSSDIYLRIYDKYAESGKEEYKDCIRFELELKGRASKAVWDMYRRNDIDMNGLLEICWNEMQRHGIQMPADKLSDDVAIVPTKKQTPIERTKDWLYSMTPKAIGKVASEYGYYELFRRLFAHVLTEHETQGILNLISLSWGI